MKDQQVKPQQSELTFQVFEIIGTDVISLIVTGHSFTSIEEAKIHFDGQEASIKKYAILPVIFKPV